MSLNDQMRLLQASWAEILTLTLSYRSLPLSSGKLRFATDFTLDELQARDCGAFEIYQLVSINISSPSFVTIYHFVLISRKEMLHGLLGLQVHDFLRFYRTVL